jgi:hypothetical protein
MMTALLLTRHAEARVTQRGFSRIGIKTIYEEGVEVGDGGLSIRGLDDLITEHASRAREAEAQFRHHKTMIQTLDKLRRRKIIADGDVVITCYCLSKHGSRRVRIKSRS